MIFLISWRCFLGAWLSELQNLVAGKPGFLLANGPPVSWGVVAAALVLGCLA
jgi:hypothetical protein